MKHVGIRPTKMPLDLDPDKKRKTYYERFDDGSYRIWYEKTLNSGCGRVIKECKRDGELIYCPVCDEWFNEEQFK
jgi:hypothetical protein